MTSKKSKNNAEIRGKQLAAQRSMLMVLAVATCLVWILLSMLVVKARSVTGGALAGWLVVCSLQFLFALAIALSPSRFLNDWLRFWCAFQLLLLAMATALFLFGADRHLLFQGTAPLAPLGFSLTLVMLFVLLEPVWARGLSAVFCLSLMLAMCLHLVMYRGAYQEYSGLIIIATTVFVTNPLISVLMAVYRDLQSMSLEEIEVSLNEAQSARRAAERSAALDPVCRIPNRLGISQSMDAHLARAEELDALILQIHNYESLRQRLSDIDLCAVLRQIGVILISELSEVAAHCGRLEGGEFIIWWTPSPEVAADALARQLVQRLEANHVPELSGEVLQCRVAGLPTDHDRPVLSSFLLEELKFRLFLAESNELQVLV